MLLFHYESELLLLFSKNIGFVVFVAVKVASIFTVFKNYFDDCSIEDFLFIKFFNKDR